METKVIEKRMELDGGKYTLVWDDPGGRQRALRHGQEWRELTGDNLVAAMRWRIEELMEEIDRLKASKDETKIDALEERDGLVRVCRKQIAEAEQALDAEKAARAADNERWNARIKLLEWRAKRAHDALLGVHDHERVL